MKQTLVALIALSLTSCAAPSPVLSTPDAVAVADRITIKGTRGLILAELAYSTVAQAALAAVQAGGLSGDDAVRVRALNATATIALARAKSAQSAAVQATAVAEAVNAIAALRGLTESHS